MRSPEGIKKNAMRGLWLIQRKMTFRSRKTTDWGLVMSVILYGIEVWEPAATIYQVKSVQVLRATEPDHEIHMWCGERDEAGQVIFYA